jgi:cysteinyl-tRNA synthetase
MGEPRFDAMQSLLPDDVTIFGLDEHTACILDLKAQKAAIRGIGTVTIRHGSREIRFQKGDEFSLELLRGKFKEPAPAAQLNENGSNRTVEDKAGSGFWEKIHSIQAEFDAGLEQSDAGRATNALLDLDSTIMQAQQDLEGDETVFQAREILRDLMVVLGARLDQAPGSRLDCMRPLIGAFIQLRDKLRSDRQWDAADAVRDALARAGVVVEDTPEGTRWHLAGEHNQAQ